MNPGGDPYLDSLQTPFPVLLTPGEAAFVYDYERDAVRTEAMKHGYHTAYAIAWGSTASNVSSALDLREGGG